jgi:hypothetical protein
VVSANVVKEVGSVGMGNIPLSIPHKICYSWGHDGKESLMENIGWLEKLKEYLAPFETERIVEFMRNLDAKTVMENPWIIGVFIVVFFYAVIKRSKFVLLFLFSCITIALLVRFTMPTPGTELTLNTTIPFAFGAIAIAGTVIYFAFIKHE